MQVASDALPLPLDGMPPLQHFELRLHLVPRRVTHASDQRPDRQSQGATQKPPRFPEGRQHSNRQRSHFIRPLAGFSDRSDPEMVFTRWQITVAGLPHATPADAVHFVPEQHERIAWVDRNRRILIGPPSAPSCRISVHDGQNVPWFGVTQLEHLGYGRFGAVTHPVAWNSQ